MLVGDGSLCSLFSSERGKDGYSQQCAVILTLKGKRAKGQKEKEVQFSF